MAGWGFNSSDYDAQEIYGDIRSEYNMEDELDIFDGFDDQDEAYDMDGDSYDDQIRRGLDKEHFESKPKHGKFAHAYSHNIDNVLIIKLREEGKTLREIARQFSCSPSTIRNRLKKMKLK